MRYTNLLFRIFFLFLVTVFQACAQSDNHIDKSEEVDIENNNTPSDIYPPSYTNIRTHSEWAKQHYPKRIEYFKSNPLKNGDIVFLGNSITEQGGDWGEKLLNSKAKNRGIAGDTTDGVLARLGELIYFKPTHVFILIGINDLFRDDTGPKKVHDNIIAIINKIHEGSPNTNILLQTILPTNTIPLKSKIEETNRLLQSKASQLGCTLILLHEEFVTENGLINMNYSNDGVHLNEKGYQVWVNYIKNYIPK